VLASRTSGGGHHNRVAVVPSPPTTASPVLRQYEVDATVLSSAAHGPQFCIQVLDSLPPQCKGTPVAGWDWTKVTGQRTAAGTTWGTYHLVGTYDGTTFTLTRPPTKPHPYRPITLPPYKTPCPTPPGGWTVVDRSHFSLNDYLAFTAAIQAPADSAGAWVDSTTPVDGRINLVPEQVITAAFTGNLEKHRAQLRAIWGGPFCVVRHPHSKAQLSSIIASLVGAGGAHVGLQVRMGTIDEVNDNIQLEVMVVTPAAQQALDQRYGAGLVRLTGVLTAVR
jgi:hypothetical protein